MQPSPSNPFMRLLDLPVPVGAVRLKARRLLIDLRREFNHQLQADASTADALLPRRSEPWRLMIGASLAQPQRRGRPAP